MLNLLPMPDTDVSHTQPMSTPHVTHTTSFISTQPINIIPSMSETMPLIVRQPSASQSWAQSPIAKACLHCQKPEGIPEWVWQDRVKFVHQFMLSPIAGISGYQGGRDGAELFNVPSSTSWMCGVGACFGLSTGYADAHAPDLAQNRVTLIMSSLVALVGAGPSAALTVQSSAEVRADTFGFIQGSACEWIDFMFAGANGLSDCILGVTESRTWALRAQAYFQRLLGRPAAYEDGAGVIHQLPALSTREKAIMIFCSLIIAYCAFTSVIGYVPPTIHLLARCFPAITGVSDICGGLATIADWLFATNMMFTHRPEEALCWNFSNPWPSNWRENRTATGMATVVGLMTGLATASYTYAAIFTANPMLAFILAQTAWMGGFWTAVRPAHRCFANPCAIIEGIYKCCIEPVCKHIIDPCHRCCVSCCCPI